jgi:hypothetical protein
MHASVQLWARDMPGSVASGVCLLAAAQRTHVQKGACPSWSFRLLNFIYILALEKIGQPQILNF